MVGHYTGTLSPTWLISATSPGTTMTLPNFPRQTSARSLTRLKRMVCPAKGASLLPSAGFEQNTKANTYGLDVATTKTYDFAGGHTLKLGYHYEKNQYDGERLYSGPNSPIPATNATGVPITDLGVPEAAVGQPPTPCIICKSRTPPALSAR